MPISRVKDIHCPLFAISFTISTFTSTILPPFCHPRRLYWNTLYIHCPFLPSQETFLKRIVHSSPLFAIQGDFLETHYAFIAPFCHPRRLSWNSLCLHRPFLSSQETFLKLTMPSSPLFVIPRDFLENWCTFAPLFAISHQIINLFFNLYILFIFIIYK